VFSQTAVGSWNANILKLLKDVKTMSDLKALQTDDNVKTLSEEALLTVIALRILKQNFPKNSKEWKMVASKGAGYVKKNMPQGASLE
jgi:hypothetical protein